MIFHHSGDYGDIIYALPAIKAMGGGELILHHCPEIRTREPMSEKRANGIIPLLKVQSYITNARFDPDLRELTAFNGFRAFLTGQSTNLADAHLDVYGLSHRFRNFKWLTPPPFYDGVVQTFVPMLTGMAIFNRSERYHNPAFPWKAIWEQYHSNAVFLGTDREHELFCSEFGHVKQMPCRDLGVAATLISMSSLFVGNQSCLAAIAEGLKKKMIVEIWPISPNCSFTRLDRINGIDGDFEL